MSSLNDKVHFIQTLIDENFRLILSHEWSSQNPQYREKIRQNLGSTFSSLFSRQELALLSDLNHLPAPQKGFVSISHCQTLGGFCLSDLKVGFDVEERSRISKSIIGRVSSPAEVAECPEVEFLWVAKEAGFKALSKVDFDIFISDLQATEWMSYFENQIWGFRLKSEKTLDFGLNKGFIFSEGPCLYGIFFK